MGALNRITIVLETGLNVFAFGAILVLLATGSDPGKHWARSFIPVTYKSPAPISASCPPAVPRLEDPYNSSVSDFMRLQPVAREVELNAAAFDLSKIQLQTEKTVDRGGHKPKGVLDQASPSALPWEAIKPITFPTAMPANRLSERSSHDEGNETTDSATEKRNFPPSSIVTGWVKAKALAFRGPNRVRPILHFELWVEPPEDIKKLIESVGYDLRSGAAQPREQESRERQSGFRVGFGSFSCVDRINLTLKFDDGRSQQIDVDGCALLAGQNVEASRGASLTKNASPAQP